jgi:D-glycerate 3-kinase
VSDSNTNAARVHALAGPAIAEVEALGPIDWTLWARTAQALASALGPAPDLDRRLHHLYLPVLFFCLARLRLAASGPLVVGIQAPQGSGKTTLVTHLLAHLPALGLRGVSVSIDDFYLTRDEQLALGAAHPGNPYLEHRGYPGTHDVRLGAETIAALRRLGDPAEAHREVRVPVYDKSAHAGRGDRRPVSEWTVVRAPLDLVFVEGWMLGFSPVPEATLPDARMVVPNRALAAYAEWHRFLDAFVVMRAKELESIVDWRVQAEADAVARGRPGLSPAAIEDYIRRFLPAYATYAGVPHQFAGPRTLTIWLDRERRAV